MPQLSQGVSSAPAFDFHSCRMSFRFPFGYNLRQFSVAFNGAPPNELA
jgi:hypothetical protein